MFDSGPAEIRRVGIVSGGGSSTLGEAIALGLDAFVTGEPTEHVMADAREGGIHFIAGGHYASETFGVQAARASCSRSGSASSTVSSRFRTRSSPFVRKLRGNELRCPGRCRKTDCTTFRPDGRSY